MPSGPGNPKHNECDNCRFPGELYHFDATEQTNPFNALALCDDCNTLADNVDRAITSSFHIGRAEAQAREPGYREVFDRYERDHDRKLAGLRGVTRDALDATLIGLTSGGFGRSAFILAALDIYGGSDKRLRDAFDATAVAKERELVRDHNDKILKGV